MKNVHPFKISIYSVFALLLFSHTCKALEETGQIPSRTQFPPLLLFLQIPNSSAVNLPEGSYYFSSYSSYSNTTVKRTAQDYNVLIDLESLRLTQSLYYGVSDSITIGAELPLVFLWRGAMDGAITNFHSVIGLPPKNDRNEKNNTYSYLVENSNFSIKNRGENVPGIGDTGLFASIRLTSAGYPLYAKIIGAIKFPTGSVKNLHGSGKTDFGAGAYLRYRINRVMFHSFASIVVPGRPEDFAKIEVTPFFTESFTVNYRVSSAILLLTQIDYNSNPFPEEIHNLGDSAFELITGIKMKIAKKKTISISLTEDITPHTTPDFSINIGFSAWF